MLDRRKRPWSRYRTCRGASEARRPRPRGTARGAGAVGSDHGRGGWFRTDVTSGKEQGVPGGGPPARLCSLFVGHLLVVAHLRFCEEGPVPDIALMLSGP